MARSDGEAHGRTDIDQLPDLSVAVVARIAKQLRVGPASPSEAMAAINELESRARQLDEYASARQAAEERQPTRSAQPSLSAGIDEAELEGEALQAATEEVRSFFWANPEFSLIGCITEALPDLHTDPSGRALAIVGELLFQNENLRFQRSPNEIFDTAVAPHEFIADTVFEVVREVLLRDPELRAEAERREELCAAALLGVRRVLLL